MVRSGSKTTGHKKGWPESSPPIDSEQGQSHEQKWEVITILKAHVFNCPMTLSKRQPEKMWQLTAPSQHSGDLPKSYVENGNDYYWEFKKPNKQNLISALKNIRKKKKNNKDHDMFGGGGEKVEETWQ